ncbi:MAG: cytochrome B6 [Leptolyngbya sp. LCM1.Bin17]|nr:MAG: cytochrome B6 [Leptolyngbya sp. LCM1.Bin17]
MKRREFINWVGVGVLASSLPIAIAACRTTAESTADAPTRDDGFTEIGSVADLDSQAVLTHDDVQGIPVAVMRDPATSEGLLAVNTLCPHRACVVEWDSGSSLFSCPCHDSKFEANGDLVDGPASNGLERLDATIEEDTVLVRF